MLGFETRHGAAVADGIWQNRVKFEVRGVLIREVRKTRRSCGDGECIGAICSICSIEGPVQVGSCIIQPSGDAVARMLVSVT